MKYYPKESLQLKTDVPGARMWAVALDKAMLTYFEVEPDSAFDMHSHDSEQIAIVLEGELFFQMENEVICVKEGEVIAIPSNAPHAVYTKETFVKALDAWPPARRDYVEQ